MGASSIIMFLLLWLSLTSANAAIHYAAQVDLDHGKFVITTTQNFSGDLNVKTIHRNMHTLAALQLANPKITYVQSNEYKSALGEVLKLPTYHWSVTTSYLTEENTVTQKCTVEMNDHLWKRHCVADLDWNQTAKIFSKKEDTVTCSKNQPYPGWKCVFVNDVSYNDYKKFRITVKRKTPLATHATAETLKFNALLGLMFSANTSDISLIKKSMGLYENSILSDAIETYFTRAEEHQDTTKAKTSFKESFEITL